MVTLFKGTKVSKNNAPQAMALCAGIAAVIDFNKTLIVQLTTKCPVEEYILGKRQKENEINDNRRHFVDNGIDNLMRHAGLTQMTDRHFRNAVLPAVDSDNLFDILPISQKPEAEAVENFIEEFDKLSCVIADAKKIYANIFILADDKDHELIKKVLPLIDNVVTCIGQGAVEEREIDLDGKEEFLLVNEYDYKSTYSDKSIAKAYGVKKVYVMAYNVEFKDAYTDRDLIRYIIHNGSDADKSNASFRIMKDMIAFTRIVTHVNAPEEDAPYTYSTLGHGKENTQLTTHSGNEINIEEKEVRRGLFGKRKKVKKITVAEEGGNDLEEFLPDENERSQDMPTMKKKKKKKHHKPAEEDSGLTPMDQELLSEVMDKDASEENAEEGMEEDASEETDDLPAIPIWCETLEEDTEETALSDDVDDIPKALDDAEESILDDGVLDDAKEDMEENIEEATDEDVTDEDADETALKDTETVPGTDKGLITDAQMDEIVKKAVEKIQEAVTPRTVETLMPESVPTVTEASEQPVVSAIERLKQGIPDESDENTAADTEPLTENTAKSDGPLTGIEWLKEFANGGGRDRFKYIKEVRA